MTDPNSSPNRPFDAQTLVGHIAARFPATVRIFQSLGFDFCCGGGRPLAEMCAEAGVDPGPVLADLWTAAQGTSAEHRDWTKAPLTALIDHIIETHHVGLPEELDRLWEMSAKVARVHAERDGERLAHVHRLVDALRDELIPHMQKEERILFPAIRNGQGAMVGAPVRVMLSEHETAGALLAELRQRTDAYQPPPGACTTWRALWHGLAGLEEDLMVHIHLENNVLFPRALAGEA